MNPYDENSILNDEEQFEIFDSLFDEDDSEDESRLQFFEDSF